MPNSSNDYLNKKIKSYKILTILFIAITMGLVIAVSALATKDPITSSKYKLLDPMREYMSKDAYIINIQSLRTYLHSIEVKYPDNVSIYYENINTGANISVGKELRLFPASLSKLVQAIIIVKKVEDGDLKWDQHLAPIPGDLSSDSGELYKTIGTSSVSVEKLLEELLVNSDNTAQNIFRRQLEISDYIAFQQETGLEDLYNEKGFISAKEYTRILRVLYTSSYLKPENSEKILEYMAHSKFKDYLSQGIPGDVKFAHKYGENKQYDIFADSGIVYVKNRPYMLTVIIKGKDSTLETRNWAVGLMKEISEEAYKASR
jgi:beta-lactamase class A